MKKLYWLVFLIILCFNAQSNEVNIETSICIDTIALDSLEQAYHNKRHLRSDRTVVEENEGIWNNVIKHIDIENLLGIELKEQHIGNIYNIEFDVQTKIVCSPGEIEVEEDATESEISEDIKDHYGANSTLFTIKALNEPSSQSSKYIDIYGFSKWTYQVSKKVNDKEVVESFEQELFEDAVSEAYVQKKVKEPVLISNERTITIPVKISETECGNPTYDIILNVIPDPNDHMVHTAIITEARCAELTDNENIDIPGKPWITKSRYFEVTDISRTPASGGYEWAITIKKTDYAIKKWHDVTLLRFMASFRENEIDNFFQYKKTHSYQSGNNIFVYIPSPEIYNGVKIESKEDILETFNSYTTYTYNELPGHYYGDVPDWVNLDIEYYRIKGYYIKVEIFNYDTKKTSIEILQVPLPKTAPVFSDNNFINGYMYRNEGQSATLIVKTEGSHNKFQWYKNGQKIPNATKNTLDIGKQFAVNNGDQYYCIARNAIGKTQSETVTISISDYPYIKDYSVSNRTLTLSEGNDMFFPIELSYPNSTKMRIDWGDGNFTFAARDDMYKTCRATNSCFWETYPHTYERPGKYTVTVIYKGCLKYEQKMVSVNQIEIKPDMTPINMLLLD